MKPIVFARVADMKYYRGITEDDQPRNGGSYVKDTGDAHEAWNFDPVLVDGEWKCFGYCQPVGSSVNPQMHIEKIVGCEAMRKANVINGVTVVFVARSTDVGSMRVIGFYKDATVYRTMQELTFDNGYIQYFQFEAMKENCVLLPRSVRNGDVGWDVPSSSQRYNSFGMGRSNIWFAASGDADDREKAYVERMLKRIDEYSGENWMNREG